MTPLLSEPSSLTPFLLSSPGALGVLAVRLFELGDVVIEQAIYSNAGGGGYRFQARSPGFLDEWLAEAERLCTGFGERPAGVACPSCVFARPFGPRHVAVVQVADQGRDDAGRPGALGFRLLILPQRLYADLGGDPFLLAEQFPPPWQDRETLPTLTDVRPAPHRTIADLVPVLKSPHSATLLGGVQALLDGGRLVFERTEPAPELVRGLWAFLPYSTRAELWPASFAFSNAHQFHVAVVPRADAADFGPYLHEEQAGDYPEGRYELALQTALDTGNQHDLDALLARRSRAQMVRLAWALLAVFILVPVTVALLIPAPPRARQDEVVPDLPPVEKCPPLSEDERTRLADQLGALGRRLDLPPPASNADPDLRSALAALDRKLGTPDPRRDPGPLDRLGPIQRELRALLWKHDVPEYNKRGLNTLELLDRLQERLTQTGQLPK